MKNSLVLLCLLVIGCGVFATQSITNLNVKNPVYLDQFLTVNGLYSNTAGDTNNVLCKFETRDINNFSIQRLSDEYTFSDGNFYSEAKLTDNLYKIDTNYSLLVTCGLVTNQKTFLVLNREPFESTIFNWYSFGLDSSNIIPILFILLFFGGLFVIWIVLKGWR